MTGLQAGSFFAGIGNFDLAMARAGIPTTFTVEIDDHARGVLEYQFPDAVHMRDITEVTPDDIAATGFNPDTGLFTGGWPCFTAGHVILTLRGLIPIEDVVVGDMVLTHRNRWKPVVDTMTRTADVVRMSGFGHTNITCTPDHPFWTHEYEWIHAKDMVGRSWATPHDIPAVTHQPAHDHAYLLGLYAGDGHTDWQGDKGRIILSMRREKADVAEKRLANLGYHVYRIEHGPKVDRLVICSTELAWLAKDHVGQGAANKTVPVWLLGAPDYTVEEFIDGVRLTDGEDYRSGWRISTVSRSLAVGLRLLVARDRSATHGLYFTKRPETTVIEGRTVNQKDTWTLQVRYPGRKWQEEWDEHHRYRRVRDVAPVGRDVVYDITVADDHSFICDGFVVHNCQDLSVAGRRAGMGADTGTRSALFWEFHRLIDAVRPAWVVAENVPGALTSRGGRDWGLAIRALVDSGYGVAWRVLDAQHFGVPQRRRRVFVVARRTAGSVDDPTRLAGEVLALVESVRGDSAPSPEAFAEAAARAARRTQSRPEGEPRQGDPGGRRGEDRGGAGDGGRGGGDVANALTSNMAGAGGGVDDNTAQGNHLVVEHDVVNALTAPATGGPRLDSGQVEGGQLVVQDIPDQVSTLNSQGDGGHRLDIGEAAGGHLIAMHLTQDPISGSDVTPALTAGNKQGCATIGVMEPTVLDGRNNADSSDVTPTLQSHGQSYSLNAQPILIEPTTFQKVHRPASTEDPEKWEERDVAATLNQFDTGDTRAVDVIVQPVEPMALSFNQRDEARMSEVGYSLQSQPGSDEQLVVTPLLEVDGRTGKSTDDPRAGIGIGKPGDPMYTLQAGKQHGVHAPDQAATLTSDSHAPNVNPPGRRKEDDENLVTMALAERGRGDEAQLEWNDSGIYNALRAGDGSSSRRQELLHGTVVRRLTPTECERLQGDPDDWTKYRIDLRKGKKTSGQVIEQSDSPRYKQLGNAVAVPVAEWIMHRLVAVHHG